MSVPLTLLGLLERGPSHGYDLKRDYDAYFGRGKPLRYSQVYATLPATWTPSGRRTCNECATSPSSSGTPINSACC